MLQQPSVTAIPQPLPPTPRAGGFFLCVQGEHPAWGPQGVVSTTTNDLQAMESTQCEPSLFGGYALTNGLFYRCLVQAGGHSSLHFLRVEN